VRPVPAPGLTYRLGRGSVVLRSDGSVEAVRPKPDAVSYLLSGGRVRVVVDGDEVSWPEPTLAADIDEAEFDHATTAGLGLVVRHSFAADWGLRIAFANHTLDPLSVAAELAWTPPAECPAWALAAEATGAYAIPGPDGQGPLLGGELALGTCDRVSADGIGLGRFTLGPLQRQVVQWRWAWYADPRTFNRNRFPAVPSDLVLPDNEAARIVADEDTAVVAPGVDTVRRGPHLELASTGGHRVQVQVSSRRGVTAYDLEWVEPLDDTLARIGEELLDGPRTRAGVVALPGVDAALVLQHLLVGRRLGNPDQADDALGLFVTRAADSPTEDGRGVSLLCGEFDRTGDADLLEQATGQLLDLDRPLPGLGLAAAQVCVARLSQGWPLDPVLTHLGRMVDTAAENGLDRAAADLELQLTAAPREADRDSGAAQRVDDRVRRIGAALGAGLRGRPLWPLPVDRQAHLAVVLGLLPEGPGARPRPEWGVSPQDVARHTAAQVLARLAGQPPQAAHSWLIMGGRLA
jgi:hypothetical protein